MNNKLTPLQYANECMASETAFLPTSLFAFEVKKKDDVHLWELGYFLAGRFAFICDVG